MINKDKYYGITIITTRDNWKNRVPDKLKNYNIETSTIHIDDLPLFISELPAEIIRDVTKHPIFKSDPEEYIFNGEKETIYRNILLVLNSGEIINNFLKKIDDVIDNINTEKSKVTALEQLKFGIYNNTKMCFIGDSNNEHFESCDIRYSIDSFLYDIKNINKDSIIFDIDDNWKYYLDLIKDKISKDYDNEKVYIFVNDIPEKYLETEEEKEFGMKMIEINNKKIFIKEIQNFLSMIIETS